MSNSLMCHVVAGYPDKETCLQLMVGLQAAGAAAIEVQIPFSDPIADGETIMRANDTAIEAGMTTAGSFDLIKKARAQGVDTDLYIMSYLQKVRHFGLDKFCQQAEICGATGLIIPDLPYDSPEFEEIRKLLAGRPLSLIPVLSPGMPPLRLKTLLAGGPSAVYVTSLRGITGNRYAPTAELKKLVSVIRQRSKSKIMIGFGIAAPTDVRDALALGDMAVVGSAIIKAVQAAGLEGALTFVKSLVAS